MFEQAFQEDEDKKSSDEEDQPLTKSTHSSDTQNSCVRIYSRKNFKKTNIDG